MKTTLLFLFAGLFSLNAQTWAPIGATWHYRELYNNMGFVKDGTREIKCTGTVTAQNKVCSQLTSHFRGASYYPGSPPPVVATTPGPTFTTYQDADVIYLYNGSGFDTVVNFKAKPGDHWKACYPVTGCDSVTPVDVTDTGHINLNGMNLKQVGLSYKKISTFFSYTITNTYTFTERVGDLNGYLFPTIRCQTDDPGDPPLTCYADNNFPVHKRAGVTECDLTTVGILEQKSQPVLSLYPNPSNGVITVETSVPVSIQVIDHVGRVLYSNDEVPPGINRIDTDLAKGIYFLVATSDNQKKLIRFVRE
jgi:hypothetical protein